MRRLIALVAAILLGASVQAHAEPPLITVEGGAIQGTTRGSVDIWLGIPYAAPPVGTLRWVAPQPVKPWQGTLVTDTFGPSCFQPEVEFVSEDCLTLNVFRPQTMTGPLPVMVWIHGGAYVRGGSRLYPMQALAAQGIVGVSLNYRLGRLGFFAHPALQQGGAVKGNFGYLDQLAALKWVRKNIAAFGGDPANVTIFGESAGGGSVIAHLIAPMSKGLFVRAIAQSPGDPSGRAAVTPMTSLDEAERLATDYAQSLGINGTDATAARELRELSPRILIAGASGPEVLAALASGIKLPGVSASIIDGTFIPDTAEAIFAAGKQNKVPFIIGSNNRDLALGVADSKEALFGQFGPEAAAAQAVYDRDGTETLDELKIQVFADKTIVEPARHLADLAAASGQKTWIYRFSYVPTVQRPTMPGTLHGMEIPYVFNLPAAIIGAANTSDEDIATAQAASAYWVNFAKTGSPNGQGLLEWPQHVAGSDIILNFTNDGVKVMDDPRAASIAVWRRYFERR